MADIDDHVTDTLRAAQKPIQRYLWTPADMITFTPAVLTQVFGDGRALFKLTTINNRPAFWIIRGCSTWQVSDSDAPDEAPEFIDFVDDILQTIEDEFGSVSCYERNARGDWIDAETKRYIPHAWTDYPTLNEADGCSWGRMDWPVLKGLEYKPHPFAYGSNILDLARSEQLECVLNRTPAPGAV